MVKWKPTICWLFSFRPMLLPGNYRAWWAVSQQSWENPWQTIWLASAAEEDCASIDCNSWNGCCLSRRSTEKQHKFTGDCWRPLEGRMPVAVCAVCSCRQSSPSGHLRFSQMPASQVLQPLGFEIGTWWWGCYVEHSYYHSWEVFWAVGWFLAELYDCFDVVLNYHLLCLV